MADHFTSLLYISGDRQCRAGEEFSKSNGFIIRECTDRDLAAVIETSPAFDLILIHIGNNINLLEKVLTCLSKAGFHYKPAVFLLLVQYPEPEFRRTFNARGVDDFLIAPVTAVEVKVKYKVYQQVKQLEQKLDVQQMKFEKTFVYLDQFKKELANAKNTLFEERETLNSALKQVNQLSKERSRLKKEKQDLKASLSANISGFSDILFELIENRVEKNRGHAERVSHIACFIAEQNNFDEKKLEDLRKAAMLHEVGLLLVPEALLNKPYEQLSGYERDLFLQVPVKGAQFLLNCSEFGRCAEIIRSMNENSDGTGWPQGLKRRYIPVLSRILAGADVFDTLKDQEDVTSLEILLEKLEQYAGSRLDPNIVSWLGKYAVLHMGSDAYKVKGVGIHQLEPGMTLGTALFTRTGTKLFSVNTLLTRDAIDKIKTYNKEYPVDETVYIRA